MKAIKFIFSKFFPTVLLMLLQLSLIVFVLTMANEYFVLFQVLCDVGKNLLKINFIAFIIYRYCMSV